VTMAVMAAMAARRQGFGSRPRSRRGRPVAGSVLRTDVFKNLVPHPEISISHQEVSVSGSRVSEIMIEADHPWYVLRGRDTGCGSAGREVFDEKGGV
jgi:hypothetical protein